MKTLITALIAFALLTACAVVPLGPYYAGPYHHGYHGYGYHGHGHHGYGR